MDRLETSILAYSPTEESKNLLKKTKILLLVGPTGSGKNTLEQELLKTGKYKPLVTHTTRHPRINRGVMEQNGNEYYFISEAEAIKMLKDKKFIEAAFTHNHLYGTSVEEFKIAKAQDKIPVADIDIKGVRVYRQLSDQVTAVFLLPPSFKALIDRLIFRYGKSQDQAEIKLRLGTALDELSELLNTDYYFALVNNRISVSTKQVLDIVDGKKKLAPNKNALKVANKVIIDIKSYLAA